MIASTNTATPTKRLHPHKFTLWIAIGSISMMFAALTSAYIVKKNQSNFLEFAFPLAFYYSTVVILLSSATLHIAFKSFKAREMQRYRILVTATLFLGVLFTALQAIGLLSLQNGGILLVGAKSNAAASFLLVIAGLHAVHVLGGVVALLILFLRAFFAKQRNYSATPIEIIATYWHFVDILWIYLFIFLHLVK